MLSEQQPMSWQLALLWLLYMHFNNITSSLKDFTQPFLWQSMFLMPYGHVYSLFYTLNIIQWMTFASTLLHVHHKHTFFVIDFPGNLWEGVTSFWRIKKYNKWYFVFILLHVHPNIHLLLVSGYECWDLSSQVQTKGHLSGESNNKYNVKTNHLSILLNTTSNTKNCNPFTG